MIIRGFDAFGNHKEIRVAIVAAAAAPIYEVCTFELSGFLFLFCYQLLTLSTSPLPFLFFSFLKLVYYLLLIAGRKIDFRCSYWELVAGA